MHCGGGRPAPRARLAGARRRPDAGRPARPGPERPARRSRAHGGAGGRPPYRRRCLLAQPVARARPRLESEAAGRVRSAVAARPGLPLPHRGRGQRHARGRRLARRPLAARLRRPDARAVRPGGSRRRGGLLGDPPRRRGRDRRRVLVRRAACRPRLAAELLHRRVAAALGARRRPRPVPGTHVRQPRARGGVALPASARGDGRARSPVAAEAGCSPPSACRSRATSPSRSRTSSGSWAARATTTRPRCS